MSRAIPLFRAVQAKLDRINQVMRETLSGVRVIRAFVRTEHEEARFDVANRDLFETSLRVNRLFAITIPTMTAIFNLSTVAVVWFGAMRVDAGELQIGGLTAFLQYLHPDPVRGPDRGLHVHPGPARGRLRRPDPGGPADRAGHRRPGRADPLPRPRPSRASSSSATSSSGYPGAEQPVLHAISFEARPGETTAIIGSTGSGKTTLDQPHPAALRRDRRARVLVDGVDVRAMDREVLWGRIGFIPQKAFLFSGTVAATCASATQAATDDELWRALEIAQGRDFVEEMEGGLEAPITQGGTNVSGGQRQRLAIARALVKRRADRRLRRQLLGARLRDRRAPAGRARAGARRRDRDHRRPARRDDHATPTGSSSSTPAGSSGAARTTSCCATNETYQEIVYSQLSDDEAAS